jgi:hypothetical protein
LRLTTSFSTLSGEADQSSNITSDIPTASTKSVVGVESEVPSSTSFSTMADQAMARKEIPPLYEYWKEQTVTDKDIITYHDAGWLPGVLVYNPTILDFPTID